MVVVRAPEAHAGSQSSCRESAVHGVRAFELTKVVGKGAVCVLFALCKPDAVRDQGVIDQGAVLVTSLPQELVALCHRGRVSMLDASRVPVADRGDAPAVVRVSVSLLH